MATSFEPKFRQSRTQDPETHTKTKLKLNSVALVRERTIPTERPPPVGEVIANETHTGTKTLC